MTRFPQGPLTSFLYTWEGSLPVGAARGNHPCQIKPGMGPGRTDMAHSLYDYGNGCAIEIFVIKYCIYNVLYIQFCVINYAEFARLHTFCALWEYGGVK